MLDYGLYRMYDTRAEADVPQDRGVFRSLEEAMEWMRPGRVREILAERDARDPA